MNTPPPITYKENNHYIIDVGHANEGKVKIVKLLGNGFAMIKDSDSTYDFEWPVKLNRLFEIKPKQK